MCCILGEQSGFVCWLFKTHFKRTWISTCLHYIQIKIIDFWQPFGEIYKLKRSCFQSIAWDCMLISECCSLTKLEVSHQKEGSCLLSFNLTSCHGSSALNYYSSDLLGLGMDPVLHPFLFHLLWEPCCTKPLELYCLGRGGSLCRLYFFPLIFVPIGGGKHDTQQSRAAPGLHPFCDGWHWVPHYLCWPKNSAQLT